MLFRSSGELLRPLDVERARAGLAEARARGLDSVAIVLMHGWRFPAHEVQLGEVARDLGFSQVSLSHQVSPLVKLVPRGETSVADAYLSPLLARYVAGVATALPPRTSLVFMQSNGGLVGAGAFRGKDAILSGPAGGVVGMVRAGTRAGFGELIGFDMGGTSTDVSRWAGRLERSFETEVAGVRLRVPMLAVHTVASGGGSICRFAAGRLLVGPQSAGAVPGPACYRLGGPATITDCNLWLGRIQAEAFPALFGPAGDQPLDRAASGAALAALADEIADAGLARPDLDSLAESLLEIANAQMAEAIRSISIARGHDPATHALVAFGGAGGQHACAIADSLGIGHVVLPADAGLLSARGIGAARLSVVREATLALALAGTRDADLSAMVEAVASAARAALAAQGEGLADETLTLVAHLRYASADSTLPVAFGTVAAMRAAFEAAHQRRFGFLTPGTPIVLEMIEAEASGALAGAGEDGPPLAPAPGPAQPQARVACRVAGRWRQVPLFRRTDLGAGAALTGPAIVADEGATSFIAPGWTGRLDSDASLILARAGKEAPDRPAPERPEAARLELMHALFMGIATEMGVALQASARSVNMKERLDFSCALFDGAGQLVANAPHIPVHLGSMGESIKAILRARSHDGRGILAGDVYALNVPWAGGTHLPDITVIAPVFLDGEASPIAFVAARGHHADIGGATPGSMPADSRGIDEEGVLFDNVLLAEAGRLREAELRALLAGTRFPARSPDQNVEDLKAQVAACRRGGHAFAQAVARHGRDAIVSGMAAVLDNAEAAVAALIGRLSPGEAAVPMDMGATIRVAIRPDPAAGRLVVDFAGTSPAQAGNFNAPPAVTRAALLYVLRCLIDLPIPLNDGCLRRVDLHVPQGSLLDPPRGAAVVAGNVETSQVVTDALFAAFGALAASAGTMSNLTFGNARHQYYETIAGGSGAGPGFPGTSAVQTHMTNSRLTDPEVLEGRFPVRVESFAIRRGSGGAGRWPGGDGTVRRLSFTEAMTVSILSNRRLTAPFGLAGGSDGRPGANRVIRADGRVEPLGPTARAELARGDAIEIETPGGGGFGA